MKWEKYIIFSTYSKEGILMKKDCMSEIRCRVSFAVLSVSSAVFALPQLRWGLTITFFFLTLAFPAGGFVKS